MTRLISSFPFLFSRKSVSRRVAVLLVFLFVSAAAKAQAPGLYINEVSQGPSGSKEYVELLVVGNPTCTGIPTLDLRGWYIDDNNGTHAAGSGTGIAQGCIRFTQDPLWAAVPIGTLIVIHNDGDPNSSVPANDLSMSDGNCLLVIPVSNCTLLERNMSTPSTTVATYPTTGFTPCGSWTPISMANSDDSFHTVDPAGNVFHSVSWGNNTLSNVIYFSGTSAGMVAFMTNATSDNTTVQANWTRVAVAGNETPGAPNNAANQAWICKMNNGCTPFTALSVSTTQVDASCTCTGSATATASGGFSGCAAGGYSYSWSPSAASTASVSNLCAGAYTVTVTDVNGCIATQTVTITAVPSFTLSATVTPVSCNGGNDGSATVGVTGGTGPFTYAWTPNVSSSPGASNLAAGTYIVNVTDASNCIGTQTVTITQPTAITASLSVTNVSCNGAADGTATLTPAGGNPSYTYSWTPNVSASNSAAALSAGNYQVLITDADGCTSTVTLAITEPALLTAGISAAQQAICPGQTASISCAPAGGTPAYTITWNPGGLNGASQQVAPAASTTYTVSVTDQSGCSATDSVLVTVHAAPVAAFTTSVQSGCAPVCVNFTDASSVSAPATITAWSWDFGDGNTSAQQQATNCYTLPGTYSVSLTVTSSDGCTGSFVLNSAVLVTPGPTAAFSFAPHPVSIIDPVVFFTDESVNAVSWSWSFGDAGQSVSSLQNPSFTYTAPVCYDVQLRVTSAGGCSDSITQEICIEPEITLYVPNAFTPNGDGRNDYFLPEGQGLDWNTFHLLVFDRWGNLIYETTDIGKPWDGKANGGDGVAQEDVYVWKIDIRGVDGQQHFLLGHVTLLK